MLHPLWLGAHRPPTGLVCKTSAKCRCRVPPHLKGRGILAGNTRPETSDAEKRILERRAFIPACHGGVLKGQMVMRHSGASASGLGENTHGPPELSSEAGREKGPPARPEEPRGPAWGQAPLPAAARHLTRSPRPPENHVGTSETPLRVAHSSHTQFGKPREASKSVNWVST